MRAEEAPIAARVPGPVEDQVAADVRFAVGEGGRASRKAAQAEAGTGAGGLACPLEHPS